MRKALMLALGGLLLATRLPASQFLFSTQSGAVNPADKTPVAATALFTVSNGQLQITVQNTEVDLKSESAALAEVTFQVSQILTSPSMTSSAELATVKWYKSFTTTSPTSTGWSLTENGSTVTLCDACTSSPVHTMIGPPNSSTGKYTSADSTITGGSHNPFLFESAGFTINSQALTVDAVISNVKFYFGTTTGHEGYLTGVGGLEVPEPSTIRLVAGGVLLLALAGCRRKSFR
ncbi:MAG: hypothetical protein ABSH44_18795 [Bryobacteraceae bacterium]|jgi:hypothetical protein